MPSILNLETGLTHTISQIMWEDVWKERIEEEPQKYRLVIAPVIRTDKPPITINKTNESELDNSVNLNYDFKYIEDLIKKSKEKMANKEPVVATTELVKEVKKKGRPKKKV